MDLRCRPLRAACLAVATAWHALAACSAAETPPDLSYPHVEGEVLVAFRPSVSVARARTLAQAKGLSVRTHYEALSARRGQAYLHIRAEGRTTAELVAELGANPNVETVVPNYIKTVCGPALPNDAFFHQLWGLHNTGQVVNGTTGTADADVDYPESRRLTRPTGGDVVVGVLDTGVDYYHPDLAPNMWFNPTENPTNRLDNDGNGYTNDYHGYDFAGDYPRPADSDPADFATNGYPHHGTHVAGTIAAVAGNAQGGAGVAPMARIMALKVSRDGNTILDSAALAAINYAIKMKTNGVNIVALNASYGGGAFNTLERNAIAEAGAVGIVFCAAAGNSGSNNDVRAYYPASYPLSNIIAVAASDQNDQRAGFSNYGTNSVDLAAPGVNVLSTLPAHLATDASVISTAATWSGGGLTYAGITWGITGAVYDCGFGHATSFPAGVSGNIALIQRGPTNAALEFTAKTSNAMAAGATAAVIYNHSTGSFLGTLQYPKRWIPAVAILRDDGLALKGMGTVTVTVINAMNPTNGYFLSDGTSMATPHVSGAVALMAWNFPGESVTQRIARLLVHVDAVTGLQNRVRTGGRLNVRKALDTDEDTLPDWWELGVTTNLALVNPDTDSDGDGFPDGREFEAGTDATNTLDYLGASAQWDSAALDGFVVRWSSVTGKSYAVLRAPGLFTNFTSLAEGLAATPPENVYTDTTAAAEERLYYRIRLE
ncbi:MAG: S8 family serine peptidase [Kiritimatiellae bacterium]|nr:S8 family serine peptidase [Kiritimatiellia bacterium]